MPILNYVRPQVEIYQQLDITLNEVGTQMSTCVIGPSYNLYRYGKEALDPIPFTTKEKIVPYVFLQENHYEYKVDTNYVRLFAEGLMAHICDLKQKMTLDEVDRTVLRLPEGSLFMTTTGGGIAEELKGYHVQMEDAVKVKAKAGDLTTRTCTILDIVGKRIPATVTVEKTQVAEDDVEVTVVSETYTGEKDTTYILVVGEDNTITVTDSAGIDMAMIFTPVEGQETTIGSLGVKIKITGVANLGKGDTIGIICTAVAESSVDFDGIRLDRLPVTISGDMPETLDTVTILHPFEGEVCSAAGIGNPFVATEEQVTINKDLALYIPDQKDYAYFEDGTGNLYLQFRVLILPTEEEEKFYLTSIEDIQAAFGTIDQDNALAYGCYAALEGSAGRAVFALRTRGIDKDAFLAAARKSQADPDMYAYAVLTDDMEIAGAVAEYNVSLCQPDVKMWRRTFWGVEALGEYTVAKQDIRGVALKATFSGTSGVINSGNNNIVQISDANDINLRKIDFNGLVTTLYPGDFVSVVSTGARYAVKRVISSNEIELEEGPKAAITQPIAISLIHADTPLNRREYVQQVCTKFNSLRKTVVWSDHALKDIEVIKNQYLACYVAGLASAVVPQQSLTRSEVTLVDSISRTYTQYTREELDEIARYGCMVIAQDTKNGPCYVRHNLTTETDKGLLYYEESCIRNIDNMSMQTDEILRGYIGKANVTESALRSMYAALTELFTRLTTNSPSDLIGPQLIRYENLKLAQDPTLKSRVLVNVDWYVPAPLNNIRVYAMSFVADVTLTTVG